MVKKYDKYVSVSSEYMGEQLTKPYYDTVTK